jgi:hypothetical protein
MPANEEAIKAVIAAAQDKEDKKFLTCIRALELAKELGVGASEIGRICNEQGIKFFQCQLGCF